MLFLPLLFLSIYLVLNGCVTRRGTPEERREGAKELFDRTTRTFHIPSAQAAEAEQRFLQGEAMKGYRELLKRYPDQSFWAAQALRSMGNIHAARGELELAVKQFRAVGRDYPGEGWEVLMAWKSAGDLLWDAGREEEAREFYSMVVERFDVEDAAPMVKTVVKGAQGRR